MRHEGRRVLGAHDHVLDALLTDDEAASHLGELAHGQARRAEQPDRVLEERALGHGDAQGTLGERGLGGNHARLALFAQHFLQALEREHETAGSGV